MSIKKKDEFKDGTTTIERTISGAAIINDLTLKCEYYEHITKISGDEIKRQDISGSIIRNGSNAVHDDLINAFKKLNIHLALISEIVVLPKKFANIDPEEIDWTDELIAALATDFTVKEFVITGTGDSSGIQLIGEKVLSTKKILKIKAPTAKLIDSDYKYINILSELIESCKYEAIEYLNGKMAPPAQHEMEFESAEAGGEKA